MNEGKGDGTRKDNRHLVGAPSFQQGKQESPEHEFLAEGDQEETE
jgi:hypothetical protein